MQQTPSSVEAGQHRVVWGGSGFPRTTRAGWSKFGTKNAGNTRRVAREEAPTASATDSSRHPRIRPRTSILVGFQPLHKMSSECAVREVPMTGSVQQRDVEGLDDCEVLQLLFVFVGADVPDGTRVAFMSATMTALQKWRSQGNCNKNLIHKIG